MDKIYSAKDVEDKIYKKWEESGLFNPDNLLSASDRYWNTEIFSMVMPPPNATGQLHIGHAMMLTLEDMMVRHARMQGKKTLWLPGTDHAAIATQNVVERQILEKEKKTRYDLGREELLSRIESFVEQTRGQIQRQIRKMGASCDWSREKYTLSPELSLAVRTAFKKMYDAGLIYKGDRIVNWCPVCATTLSDDEVEYKPTAGKLYYVNYPLAKGEGNLTIATTRPETMLADTAVAVHPEDSRYKKYIGKTVMLPTINRELPVIADTAVDRDFGTGVLKVTPGHDPIDFEIGQRHDLETINLFTPKGKIYKGEAFDHGFESYAGLTIEEAREKILQELKNAGFLDKTEDIEHKVGLCYRSQTIVEPVVSKQWFVNVNKKIKIQNESFRKLLKLAAAATLKEMAQQSIKTGAIKIVPERFKKNYLHWIDNLRDWNISRQIWFGHQIPVWYCEECGEVSAEIEAPRLCRHCNSANLKQDEDTLDTWFSSSLWTFSALGWPNENENLKVYHPTTILETGYDILFFWVARMIIMTGFCLEDIPFRTVYLHGLVRNKDGKKMSKSSGNVINPLEMIEKYGTDSLRLSLIMGTTPGNDLKIYEAKIKTQRNFINKLWNISRFVLQKNGNSKLQTSVPKPESMADQWILEELENLISTVNKHFEGYQYALAAEALHDFTWNKFADWYVEIAKIKTQNANGEKILPYVLQTLLKLWHPFVPFITEQIWSQISDSTLMIQEYPTVTKGGKSQISKSKLQKQFEQLQELITGLRNIRAEYKQPPAQIFAAYLELAKSGDWLKDYSNVVEKLARVKLNFAGLDEDKKMPYFYWGQTKVYLIIPKFDAKKEKQLAEKELEQVQTLAKKLESQLKKKAFIAKAPAEVVEKLKTDFAQATERIEQLKEKIKAL